MKKKALVTGASGVVGNAVCNLLLERDYSVHPIYWSAALPAWYSRECKKHSIYVDLTDAKAVRAVMGLIKPDLILHLAANNDTRLKPENPQEIFAINILSTVNILSGAVRNSLNIPILITSTTAGTEEGARDGENHTPYILSKRAVEMIADSYNLNYGLEVIALRCGNVYGPGDRNAERLIPSIINSIIKNKEPIFRSPLTESRKFIYSFTLAKALMWLVDNRKQASQKLLTLNGGHSSTIAQIFRTLRLVSEENFNLKNVSYSPKLQMGDICPRFASGELIVEDIELELGLLETFNWYRQNSNKEQNGYISAV